jgi:outer membrane protein, multidrug efflux system
MLNFPTFVFGTLVIALAVAQPDAGVTVALSDAGAGPAAAGVTFNLESLIASARDHDGRVKTAEADVRILRGKYEEARWAWFPVLTANAFVAGPTPEAKNNGLGGPPTTQASYLYDLNWGTPGVMLGTEISGVLPIYTFGKLSALEDLAANAVKAGKGLHEAAQDEAEMAAAQAYWGYQAARDGRDSLNDLLDRLKSAETTLNRLREQKSEQVTQMDVYKLSYYRRQIEARLPLIEGSLRLAVAAMRALTDTPQETAVRVTAQGLPEPHVPLSPVDAYVSLARDNRPELRAISAGIAAREKEVFINERWFFPDFGLGAFFRWRWTTSTTRQISPFAYDPYNELTSGLGIVGRYSFDIPQKMARLEQSRGELQKIQEQRDLLLKGVRLEIEKIHADLSDALGRSAKQADAEKSARRWATSAYAAFDLGTSDTRELTDSLTALGVSSSEKIKAWFDVQMGFRALARATGTSSVIPVFGGTQP